MAEQRPASANALADDIVGAVCVIRNGDNLVLLSEVITKKFSLPGGYIDKGDTPEQAAAREALEETGIVVEVKHLIQYRGRAAIYACQATSPIPVSSFKDSRGYPIVASWFSKHFATEVERTYLIDPTAIDEQEYRYAEDMPLLPQWLSVTPESDVIIYERFDTEPNILHQYELGLIEQFQFYTSTWSTPAQWLFTGVMRSISIIGEPWFVFLMAVLFAGYFRTPLFLEVAFLIVVSLYCASLLKHGLTLPRPFFIVPELQKINAYGFGFPSGHILLTTLICGILSHFLRRRFSSAGQQRLIAVVTVLLILGQCVARVWFGAHFISDAVLSLMLGIVIVAIFIAWRNYEFTVFQHQLTNRWFWLGLSVIVGVTAGISLVPGQAYLFAVLLGVVLTIDYAEQVDQNTPDMPFVRQLIACVCVLAGAFAINGVIAVLSSMQTVSLIVLGIKGVGYLVLGAWLLAGSSWVRALVSR
ncbi:bifunctional NUDIX hydrolase/phosphatase PAP2 family protein [Photobacterium lutimaris]|uniref:bifunctional NUDIX hydrolase/phosphatase PAP2 family protein n=1 Tax=Photobacterium lutimaris TaxID=388278 RepID=UPI0010F3DE3B|nr:phosphatase PAP2 family protein [Photobacterium lutimaris]TDR77371.1 ADP-ribose pyrophosphatase YjhB (NUDIX family) [Photobacterium lutimaris]